MKEQLLLLRYNVLHAVAIMLCIQLGILTRRQFLASNTSRAKLLKISAIGCGLLASGCLAVYTSVILTYATAR